jgi:hypothetical protein
VASLLVPLVHPATLRADSMVYIPAPLVDRIFRSFGGPQTPSFFWIIEQCDPGWRTVLEVAGGSGDGRGDADRTAR